MKIPATLLAASMAIAPAAEITVEAQPFRIERGFTATLLPTEPASIAIDPEGWGDFTIDEIVPHGRLVKKGEVLVKFDRETLDRKLEDSRRAVEASKLKLASQELAFTKLEEETALKLEAARRAQRDAAEELDYFTTTGRKAQEDDIANDLEGYAQRVEAAKEELKQLKMMYDADDLTEQTEEIILKRQEFAVKSAETGNRLFGLNAKRTLEVSLPRKAEALDAAAKSSAIELEKAEKNLPRALETAKIELDAARVAATREKDELADLEKDAALMEIKAQADGMFYHGSLDDGRWSLGELAKALVKGGKVPLIRPFATLVPADAEMMLVAQVDDATARGLKKPLKGSMTAAGREDIALTVTIQDVASVPAGDGKFRIDLLPEWPEHGELEWPADLDVAPGMNFQCQFVVHQEDNAITLPLKALHAAPEGKWTVRVKLADGKSEPRAIERGRVSGDRVEIVNGLDNGQVIIVPD